MHAVETHRRIGVHEIAAGRTARRRDKAKAAVPPGAGGQVRRFLQIVIPREHAVPSQGGAGAPGREAPVGDSQNTVGVVRIGAREVVLRDGHAFASWIGIGIHVGRAEVGEQPSDGQAIRHQRAFLDRIRLHISHGVAQRNPAAIGTVNIAAELAGEQIHLGCAGVLEINPADVCAIGITAQIAKAVLVHAEIAGGIVLILDLVGGRAAAEVDPADVGGIDIAGADVFTDDGAVVGVAAPVQPAEVRAVGIAVADVNGRRGVNHRQRSQQRERGQKVFH